MRAPNETKQPIVMYGKMWWTCMRCMVAYGRHALVANSGSLNLKRELNFKFK